MLTPSRSPWPSSRQDLVESASSPNVSERSVCRRLAVGEEAGGVERMGTRAMSSTVTAVPGTWSPGTCPFDSGGGSFRFSLAEGRLPACPRGSCRSRPTRTCPGSQSPRTTSPGPRPKGTTPPASENPRPRRRHSWASPYPPPAPRRAARASDRRRHSWLAPDHQQPLTDTAAPST